MARRLIMVVGVLVAIPVGIGGVGTARADVYRAVDAQGVVHLTNVPTDSRYQVMIRAPRQSPRLDGPDATAVSQPGGAEPYRAVVAKVARELSLDRALLRAVIAAESGYDPHAVSSRGAVGLMQLMPKTAQRYGVTNRFDPVENIRAGARYLRDLMHRFHDNLPLALAAYNAGEDAVAHFGNRIPPYPETRQYVPRVMRLYRRYRSTAH